jgi:hypothetical protein
MFAFHDCLMHPGLPDVQFIIDEHKAQVVTAKQDLTRVRAHLSSPAWSEQLTARLGVLLYTALSTLLPLHLLRSPSHHYRTLDNTKARRCSFAWR